MTAAPVPEMWMLILVSISIVFLCWLFGGLILAGLVALIEIALLLIPSWRSKWGRSR